MLISLHGKEMGLSIRGSEIL